VGNRAVLVRFVIPRPLVLRGQRNGQEGCAYDAVASSKDVLETLSTKTCDAKPTFSVASDPSEEQKALSTNLALWGLWRPMTWGSPYTLSGTLANCFRWPFSPIFPRPLPFDSETVLFSTETFQILNFSVTLGWASDSSGITLLIGRGYGLAEEPAVWASSRSE